MVDFFTPLNSKSMKWSRCSARDSVYTGEMQLGGLHGSIHSITEYHNCLPPPPHQSSTAVFRLTVKDPRMQNPYEVCNGDIQVSNSGNYWKEPHLMKPFPRTARPPAR